MLLGEAYRPFSTRLADSPLLQWFCQLDRLDVVRVPAKSTLQRYAHWLPDAQMRPYADIEIMRTCRRNGPFYRAFELGKSA
jgi:hypothetical protein